MSLAATQYEVPSFEDVYFQWHLSMGAVNGFLDEIFHVVEIESPRSGEIGLLATTWCSRKRAYRRNLSVIVEKVLNEKPKHEWDEVLNTCLDDYPIGVGSRNTVRYLWDICKDSKKICALLMCASFFPRVSSGKKNFDPNMWPPFAYMCALESVCKNNWLGKERAEPTWHHLCTNVLPVSAIDHVNKHLTFDSVVEFFSLEHLQLFSAYMPVAVVAVREG